MQLRHPYSQLAQKIILLATIMYPSGSVSYAQPPTTNSPASSNIQKKIIGLVLDPPDTATVRQNLKQIEEETPFNGIAIGVKGKDDAGNVVQVANVFSKTPWKRAWFQSSVADLKAIRAQQKGPNNNFVLVRTNPGIIDWFDDEGWKQVVDHWRTAAWLAKEGGMKGLMFDPENYSHLPQFNYKAQLGAKDLTFPEEIKDPLRLARIKDPSKAPTFQQFQAKVRQRGQEVIQAVAQEDPNLTIYALWMNSLNLMATGTSNPQVALRITPSGLYPSFIDGWLDKAPSTMTFVDGCEWGYGYDSQKDFLQAANEMRNTVLKLVAPENRLKHYAQVQPSFGIYMDPYVNPASSIHHLDSKGVTPVERLRMRTEWALESASEYVWLYGEQYRWWPTEYPGVKPENWNETLPGITEALRSTTHPHGNNDFLLAQLQKEGKAINLIKNGDFSSGKEIGATGPIPTDWKTDEALPGWSSWQTEDSKGTFEWDPTVTHSGEAGNGAVKVRNVGDGGSAIQVVTVNPGESYLLRAWVRTLEDNPGFIRVRWKTPDEMRWTQEGRDVLLTAPAAARGEWSQISGTITVPPDAGKLILLMMVESQSPKDALWFDDVELYKLPG